MAKSVKKNLGYNLILTGSNYIFPLIIYPYVSRVLGVVNLGICNYVDGIIHYYILLSTLGIASYGVREMAKTSNDFDKCSKTFSNLFSLNFILTIVACLILLLTTFTVPALSEYKPFLLIGLVKLIANLFLTEWFFQGIQQFKYITIRSIIVRSIYVVAVFAFIHNKEDVNLYYLFTTLMVVINAFFNWRYSLKFRKFSIKGLSLKTILIPVLVFGYYRILTSMYTTFNVVYLGSVCGDKEVGYFSTATKLYTIIMSVFSALTTVMVPHVSQLLRDREYERLQVVANKTISIICRFSIPIIVFCQFFASQIILLLSGPGYEGAILPFRIVIFLLLIIGMEQISIQQFLMASTSNKSIMYVSSTGAIVGILLNIFLTKNLGSIGSAFAWGVSEFSVLVVGVVMLKKTLNIHIDYQVVIINIASAFFYILPIYFISQINNQWLSLCVGIITLFVLFMAYNLFVIPDNTIKGFYNSILKRFSK